MSELQIVYISLFYMLIYPTGPAVQSVKTILNISIKHFELSEDYIVA